MGFRRRVLAPNINRMFARSLLAVGVALLAACGGGGSSNSVSSGGVPELAISGFTPASAGAGAVVTISGAGMAGVRGARVGTVAASFVVDSATQVRVTVPTGASSGRIELATVDRVVLSATDLIVTPVPLVVSISPANVTPPARITVTGTNLDLVAQARLNNTVLAIASQAATSLALDVPVGASTGFLTLVATDGVARQSAQQVTVAGSMSIDSFAPATIARGASLTINGANLDRATSVQFAGNASAPIASRSGAALITVIVPTGASSGVFTVIGNANEQVLSPTALTVMAPIQVDANATYRVAAGVAVAMPGTGLSGVNSVRIGSSAAVVVSQNDTQVVFNVPAGVNCGPITLSSAAQAQVAAGSVIVGAGCTVRVAGVEFAQVLSQAASEPRQRLVPRKETLVRAYVVSETSGTLAPTVRVTGFNGATVLGALTMSGPATLPVLGASAAPPASLRYNETQTFNASLPADWVASGLSLRIDVDPEQRYGTPVAVDATPNVGSRTRINLVLVPLVSGANAPQMPDPALALDEIVRRLPVAREDIVVSVRAPYTLTSVTDGVDVSSDWSNALSELEQLRRREAPAQHYYGFVRPMVSAGTAGVGYVNNVGASSPNLSSMGWDASRNWRRTMTHELGHNFSRLHAPCGGVSSSDPNYPYANGDLSDAPLFESLLDDIQSPIGQSDVMGYCSGGWFSDYNLREVQRFLEARPQAAGAAFGSTAGEVLVISGRIDANGVALDPVQRMRGIAPPAYAGDYTLRLKTVDGSAIEARVDAIDVDHAIPAEQHFVVMVPAAGTLASAEVLRGQTAVPLRSGSRMRAQSLRGAERLSGEGDIVLDWREVGGTLDLAWSAGTARFVTVTHVVSKTRTVLAIDASGGAARLDVSHLPSGGEFEVSFSNGLNAQLMVVAR